MIGVVLLLFLLTAREAGLWIDAIAAGKETRNAAGWHRASGVRRGPLCCASRRTWLLRKPAKLAPCVSHRCCAAFTRSACSVRLRSRAARCRWLSVSSPSCSTASTCAAASSRYCCSFYPCRKLSLLACARIRVPSTVIRSSPISPSALNTPNSSMNSCFSSSAWAERNVLRL